MNDAQYLAHCHSRWREFATTFVQRTEALDPEDPLRQLALACDAVGANTDDLYREGPTLVSRLFTTFPDFAPTLPRELLWFLGGDCLHYMAEEEIALFQQLDEEREAAAGRGEVIDFEAARRRLAGG